MRNLEQIRPDIDRVDEQIRALYLERMALASEVATYKIATDGKIFQPVREDQMVDRLSEAVPAQYKSAYRSLVRAITRYSRESQYQIMQQAGTAGFSLEIDPTKPVHSVCYQGTEGAYQQIAAQSLYPTCSHTALPTWLEVFTAVSDGTYDVGVVPIDNSAVGTVDAVYDLLSQHNLHICDSYILPIHHCLASVLSATADSIQTVFSHPHALRQCEQYLEAHGYASKQAVNTAIAAEFVRDAQDPTLAAICSQSAAERCGLQVIAPCINDQNNNETRFIAISRHLTVAPTDDCIELMFTLKNQSGTLNTVLSIFADYGVNMTRIHSRPNPVQPWTYIFYADIVANLNDAYIQPMLFQLTEESVSLRVMGSYHLQTPVVSQ